MSDKEPKDAFNEEPSANTNPTESGTRQPSEKYEPQLLPVWKVLLHSDDATHRDAAQFEDALKVVRRLTPLNEDEARVRIQEANDKGIALLLTTHQERAELYVEQFAGCHLTVSIEPDA